ncbi:hypothetical protein [Bradyrhizobium murdochi]|uniref:hypothetical protein n=1 Tax=Bradyrhizobium murdochi TaxID=1038859 RepID=UPI0018DE24CB|nr:hypothetical protein [Bradyrhizobium murdochi]
MKQPSLRKAALAVSVFTCATMLSFDWSEQRGASLSIERAQAQTVDPLTPAPGVTRRQARRAAAGAAAVGAGAVAAGATAAYYGSGPYAYDRGNGPYAYYGGNSPNAYYGGPGVWSQDYAARNGIICQPGTMVRLDDGLMHRCQ